MSGPIIPAAPVNAIISIQPLPTSVPSQVASDVPSVLAALAGGTTVQGFVINRDGQSNPVLRTNLGDVLVRSDVFIKTGSEVIIRVDINQPGRARIISIDGLVPEDYVSQSARAVTRDTISNSALPSQPAASATAPSPAATPAGPALEALVLKSTPSALPLVPGETIPPRLVGLKPGQPLRIQILSAQLPQAAISLATIREPTSLIEALLPPAADDIPAVPQQQSRPTAPTSGASAPIQETRQQPAAPLTSAAAQAQPPAPQTALPIAAQPQPTSQPAQAISVSTTATSSPQSVTAPAAAFATPSPLFAQEIASAPAIAAAQISATSTSGFPVNAAPFAAEPLGITATIATPPDTVQATVIGHEADGAAILHTSFATLKLYTAQPLPQGTQLTLIATTSEALAPTPLPLAGAAIETLHTTGRDLDSTLDVLAQLSSTLAGANSFSAQIPAANERLASTLLFFLAAVKGGDVREFLGSRGVDKLRILAPDLLSRLGGDIEKLQPFLSPPAATPWTGIALPIFVQGETRSAYLYLKHDDEREGDTSGASGGAYRGQRFIVDVELTQLGSMQFDGFVRTPASNEKKQLDLVIRSSRSLPAEVVAGIRERFDTTLAITGLGGQAIFQQGTQHFIRPQTATPEAFSAITDKAILA